MLEGGGLQPQPSQRNGAAKRPQFQTKLLFAYRENEIYKTQVPKLVGSFQKRGFEVEELAFPKGTPEEEIKDSLSRNAKLWKSFIVVSDETVKRNWPSSSLPKKDLLGQIDKSFDASVKKQLFESLKLDPFACQYHMDYKSTGRIMVSLIKAALRKAEEDGRYPNRIIVLTRALWEHAPFNQLLNPNGDWSKEDEVRLEALGANVAKWFEKASFRNPKNIRVIGDPSALYELHIEANEIVWFIGDRHLLSRQELLSKIKIEDLDDSRFFRDSVESLHSDSLSTLKDYLEDSDGDYLEAYDRRNPDEDFGGWGEELERVDEGIISPGLRRDDEYERLLNHRLREQEAFDQELEHIHENEENRSHQYAAIISALGLEPSGSGGQLLPQHIRRPHLPLPLSDFLNRLYERDMLPHDYLGAFEKSKTLILRELEAKVQELL